LTFSETLMLHKDLFCPLADFIGLTD